MQIDNYHEATVHAKVLGGKSHTDPIRPAVTAEAQLYATLAVADALRALVAIQATDVGITPSEGTTVDIAFGLIVKVLS